MLKNTFANTALCQHIRLNGKNCGQPALRGRRFCRFHQPIHSPRPDYSLPMVEDALSLQFALMQVIRALHDHAIGTKTAALTLYALQIASGNLRRFLEESNPEVSGAPHRPGSGKCGSVPDPVVALTSPATIEKSSASVE